MYTNKCSRKTNYTEPRAQSSSTTRNSLKRPSPEPCYSTHSKISKQQSSGPFYKRATPLIDGEHDDLYCDGECAVCNPWYGPLRKEEREERMQAIIDVEEMKDAEEGWKKAQARKTGGLFGANTHGEKTLCEEVEVVMVDDSEGWTVIENRRKR